MPVSVMRISLVRKLKGYGGPSSHCEKAIFDVEYLARSKTRGTSYYRSVWAQLRLIDRLVLHFSDSPFRLAFRSNRIASGGLRKKFSFSSR
ncbi:MAG: hypothetical protein PXY39_05230 [archaeon]|nr:hypothetical protein [archaeon]